MKYLFSILLLFLIVVSQAQIVSLQPTSAGGEDEVTLVFDATQGNAELVGASKVYMHHGVVTDSVTGTDWKYVIGNWGKDDGVGQMTRVSGETDKWQITFSPTLREYFKVPTNENIFRISTVFRSADGNTKGTIAAGSYGWGDVTSGGDFYINLNIADYVTITNPVQSESYISAGSTLNIDAVASSEVSTMSLLLNEGNGYEVRATVSSGKNISYAYKPSGTVNLGIKVAATIKGEVYEEEKTHQIVLLGTNTIAELPTGIKAGINYSESDNTTAILALEAPGKDFAYVVGDFNNWSVSDNYKMNQTPDGEYFWIELESLIPQQEYVFQYWIDGEVKVGDPYADKVADPWNDKWISDTTYPNLPEYDKTDYGIATVLQTGQETYSWNPSETTWDRPDLNNTIIYELHVRDFLASHSYVDLVDTLSYLKRLGVDAIELMPVNEFEGNDSWGYNPNYYFAPDKYYGTKDELKHFIEAAHQNGLAVIQDMVLNHAYGTNAMVKMYWDNANNRPAADNPWFNQIYVGPYSWGYDFNHESEYTQRFIDRVNAYWLEEFHVDGFRFDFTKGFTNYAPGGSIDGYDQSRIDILKRMADQIWTIDPNAYVILEHWGPASEETVLGNYGMKMWSNRSYDFVPAVNGSSSGNFDNLKDANHVIYFDSHDEQRIANHALTEGLSNEMYDVQNPLVMFERVKMAAAFNFLQPGPKMIWQFDEVGYDIDIDYNGRVGAKPLPWGTNGLGYYEDQNRQYIYDTYKAIFTLRKAIGAESLSTATTSHKTTGVTRRMVFNTDGIDLVVVGNFGVNAGSIAGSFPQTGVWFDYFSGEEINVSDVNETIELQAGEWHVYTSEKLSEGLPGVVEVFSSPVAINPSVFNMNDEITITFDASKAWNDGTAGLMDANDVKLVAGIISGDPNSALLDHLATGAMTSKGNNIWEIKLSPAEFFGVSSALKIGMYFTDAAEHNLGKGFRNSIIYSDVLSTVPIVSIEPAEFKATDEITITFNAQQGDRNLMGTSKVYVHSGVGTVKADNPASTAWNHVIGNWGQDDGVGEMTEVENDVWQITIVPKTYYGLADGDFPYWIACVFRNADGSVKGSGDGNSTFETGFISSGGDIFIQNQLKTSVDELENTSVKVYPNPTERWLYVDSNNQNQRIELFNLHGKRVLSENLSDSKSIDIAVLQKGVYIYRIFSSELVQTGRIIKK